eukprot:TRINITY_DN2074_c0_g3_i1.p1 TRINITY_DN2074_c0_g3~~TRINITY_DN2074_c0_g3_i1.p1  ORF type:complete len:337 (+),score=77.75 TRINITY_DN2074_c0_g3_i1:143-1012(+)
MSAALAMNQTSSSARTINNLREVHVYLIERIPLNGVWNPLISSPKEDGLPKKIATWVLLASKSPRGKQNEHSFHAIDAHCIFLVYAQHHKLKVMAVQSSQLGRMTFGAKKFRDELAGAENNICTAIIGIVNDMISEGVDKITLPTGQLDVQELLEEGVRAAGKAVQLRTEKYEEKRDHPAYPAALNNCAEIIMLAAKFQDDEGKAAYEEEAKNLKALALEASTLDVDQAMIKADASISIAHGAVDDDANENGGMCVYCLEVKADHVAKRCSHLTLCEKCFDMYRSMKGL